MYIIIIISYYCQSSHITKAISSALAISVDKLGLPTVLKIRESSQRLGSVVAGRLTPLKTLQMALETRTSWLSASRSNITPRSCCCTFSSPSAAKKALVIWRGQRSDGNRSWTGWGEKTGHTRQLSSGNILSLGKMYTAYLMSFFI